MDLLEVVDQAEHLPLAVHLGFASEGEAIQAQDMADMGENRFNRTQSPTVDESADSRIDLVFHLLGEGGLALLRATMEVGDLPDHCGLRLAQALLPEMARYTS